MSLRRHQSTKPFAAVIWWLTLALCALFSAPPAISQAQSAPTPLTIAQYDADLASIQANCSKVAQSQGSPKAAAAALADLLPLLHAQVLEPGASNAPGSLVFVDNRPLAGLMQSAALAQATDNLSAGDARAARWQAIEADVAQIRAALPAAPAPRAADAHTLAAQVLSASDFASEPIPPKSIWEQMGDAIQRWWNRIHWPRSHHAIGDDASVSPLVPEIILIAVAIAAIGLIVYFTVLWLRERGARTAREQKLSELDLAFTAEEKELVATHNYARLRALADEAAQTGDFRSGYRLLFLAILVYLDAEGAIRLNRSKTNWEYLRSLPSASPIREILRPVVREFDRIWYGERPALQAEFDLAAEVYTSIQQSIESERRASDPTRLAATTAGAGAGAR